jgi:hypothetical protein
MRSTRTSSLWSWTRREVRPCGFLLPVTLRWPERALVPPREYILECHHFLNFSCPSTPLSLTMHADDIRKERKKATKHDSMVRVAALLNEEGRQGVEAAWEQTDEFHEKWRVKSREFLAQTEWKRRKTVKRVRGWWLGGWAAVGKGGQRGRACG